MDEEPLFLSALWPPMRRVSLPGPDTFSLMEATGLVRRSPVAGVFALLPLGVRVRDQLARISRSAFERTGFSTVSFPTLQSRDMWEQSGRWDTYVSEGTLFTLDGGAAGAMCLAPTSEEISVTIVRSDLRSYRDLPARLFLSTSKFRNEVSPRGGLMRAREFEMADAYTFDSTPGGMRESVRRLNDACRIALTGMGLRPSFQVAADGGSISSGPSTEHVMIADFGQSHLLACPHCGNRGAAELLTGLFTDAPGSGEAEPVVKVMAYISQSTRRVVAVLIREDLRVSDRKVTSALGEPAVLLPADQVRGTFDREPGTLNPWDALKHAHLVLFDGSVSHLPVFTIASPDGLRTGITWDGSTGFDAVAPEATDVHCAVPGLPCSRCGVGRFEGVNAVELAHVFELGLQYSARMGLEFIDAEGLPQAPYMACSGIGLTRCLQTVAGKFRDHLGLRWPTRVGPADVHLVSLRSDITEVRDKTHQVARAFARSVRVLADDRPVIGGDKFAYASALGVPFQVVISQRMADDEVELINRWTGRRELTTLTQAVAEVTAATIGVAKDL
jgi:prolyl-tRNA synthetase